MNKVSYEIIEINNVFFYVEQQVLVMKDGSKKKVPESELKIILALVNAEGKELTRDELLNIGWSDVIVNESSLIQAISNIRKKLLIPIE
ncbi:winged helix-turn-helix domain-containing protein [uncultured Vibrio sp.]|uniref:winged helix-turn-helix domain-containing protein n=1 Tax=uncultured Vibrio sp. TaxID=114054 RepID=UPI0026368BA7|nr:winged helix-turn-helix domain-containing protein [uncultured Vibrio sp.]